ncbi:leucine-rich repeat and WD repeat-containing protein 1 isoform X2 [Phyllobates terribilis]
MYEENLYLTVSDNYKVCCLLPKLRRLNNKDITSLANHVRFVNHRELSSRVKSYWEKNYKDKMHNEPTPAMIKSISKEFLKSVGNHVKYGPNSLKDFTRWKVQIIADHLISSLLGEEKSHKEPPCEEASSFVDSAEASVTPSKKQNTDSDSGVRSPSKRLRSNAETNYVARTPSKRLLSNAGTDCEVTSPTKRLRSSEVLTIVLSPKSSSKLQESPLKSTSVSCKMYSTPVKAQATRGLLTPTKVSSRSIASKPTVGRTVTSGKEKATSKKKQFYLEPLHFLQSHSKNNTSDDFCTQLWSCAFEPNLDDSSSSKVIASCGGGSVCVIDCETGKVLKKYKVPGEEFFALAWTTLTMICNEGQKRRINVLAAGGRFGVIKLMEPKVGLCYGEIKAHKKAISIMCFSPAQDTFLFTGSYDKRIILWDIGVPDHEYNFRASQLLTLDTTSTPLRLSPVPASPDQHLMAACEDGCFVWDITLNKQQGKRSYEVEFNFPIYNKESKDSDFHIVDGLAFLSDDLVVSKSAMQGSIYIWSWKKSFQRPKSKSSRKAEAHILAELKWSETDLPYLAPTTSIDGHCVMCGDEAGKIWIYDLESCKAELEKGVPCKALKEPTKIIDWPYPVTRKEKVGESVINTVLVDPGMEYLVALTDKNIIAIWKIL